MKRWWLWLILTLLVGIPPLVFHSRSSTLLEDTDTVAMLAAIRERKDPLSWFAGDWPLQNHFYRPLPTLTFVFDNKLYGDNDLGYGWTNAILCSLSSIALLWLLAELLRSPFAAFGGAALFTVWTLGFGDRLAPPLLYLTPVLILAGLYRHSLRVGKYFPAILVVLFLATEMHMTADSTGQMSYRVMYWLPGRTATVMTLFALVSMAAYVRFERSRGLKLPFPPAKATDPPVSTRTTDATVPSLPWFWFGLSLAAAGAALSSYEQAVMLPAALFGLAVFLRWRRQLPCWWCHLAYWLLLAAYLLLRHALIPSGASHYQSQQFRNGPAVFADLLGYVAPNVWQVGYAWVAISDSIWALLVQQVWTSLLFAGSTVVTAFQARRHLALVVTGLLLSLIAFLPMAWLKQFGHYHYWPMALRILFVIGVVKIAWDLISIAASPPELQAPTRPSPAPGSLPHP